jgi:DNA-binding transcriptional LysR family regulator
LGVKLFQRSTKKIELSNARRSIQLVRETEAVMSRFTTMVEGRLLIGASLSVGEYVLPRLFGPFNKEYPNTSVSIRVIDTAPILGEFVSHQLNLSLVKSPLYHPYVHSEPVLSHELAEPENVTVQEFQYPGTTVGVNPTPMRIFIELDRPV